MNIPARLSLLCLMLHCLGSQRAIANDDPLLPRPQTHVLDQAQVLLPETKERLDAEFTKAEREYSLYLYLVIVPHLKNSSPDRRESLENTAITYASSWIKEVGALILYNDETGLVTVAYSDEAKRIYTEIALDAALKAPLQQAQISGLTREKLERLSLVLVNIMTNLQQETALKAPKRHTVIKIIGATLTLCAIGMIIYHSLNGQPITADVSQERKPHRRRRKHDKW